VIEFNVRFGDPEAQVVLPLIAGSFVELLVRAAAGELDEGDAPSAEDKAVAVVLASRGYPQSSESGMPIEGVARAEAGGAVVFHAGTRMQNGRLVTAGGRVLAVMARGPSFGDATAAAYRAVGEIHFNGMQFRRDIGRKAIEVTT
jgi:phosphoribosylamine--glycine ligase